MHAMDRTALCPTKAAEDLTVATGRRTVIKSDHGVVLDGSTVHGSVSTTYHLKQETKIEKLFIGHETTQKSEPDHAKILERMQIELRKRYRQLQMRGLPWWPKLPLNKCYVNLALTDGENKLQLNQLFNPSAESVKSTRILVEGEAGFGKTTLACKLCYDWANNVDYMACFNLVILLQLRNFQMDFKETLAATLNVDSYANIDSVLETIAENAQTTLLVLDGYDEASSTTEKCLHPILCRDQLKQVTVLVTARPGKFKADSNYYGAFEVVEEDLSTYLDKTVSIIGLEKEDQQDFLKKHLITLKWYSLKKLTSVQECINKLVPPDFLACPLFLLMLVLAFPNGDVKKVNSKTDLFKMVLNFIVRRYLSKTNRVSSTPANVDVFKFVNGKQPKHAASLAAFGELAINALAEDRLVFTKEELLCLCEDSEMLLEVGLVKPADEVNDVLSDINYEPVHKSLLEFLGAYSVWMAFVTNPDDFEETLHSKKMVLPTQKTASSLTFVFLCGLFGHSCHLLFHCLRPFTAEYSYWFGSLFVSLQECIITHDVIDSLKPLFPVEWTIPWDNTDARTATNASHQILLQHALKSKKTEIIRWFLGSPASFPDDVKVKVLILVAGNKLTNWQLSDSKFKRIQCSELLCDLSNLPSCSKNWKTLLDLIQLIDKETISFRLCSTFSHSWLPFVHQSALACEFGVTRIHQLHCWITRKQRHILLLITELVQRDCLTGINIRVNSSNFFEPVIGSIFDEITSADVASTSTSAEKDITSSACSGLPNDKRVDDVSYSNHGPFHEVLSRFSTFTQFLNDPNHPFHFFRPIFGKAFSSMTDMFAVHTSTSANNDVTSSLNELQSILGTLAEFLNDSLNPSFASNSNDHSYTYCHCQFHPPTLDYFGQMRMSSDQLEDFKKTGQPHPIYSSKASANDLSRNNLAQISNKRSSEFGSAAAAYIADLRFKTATETSMQVSDKVLGTTSVGVVSSTQHAASNCQQAQSDVGINDVNSFTPRSVQSHKFNIESLLYDKDCFMELKTEGNLPKICSRCSKLQLDPSLKHSSGARYAKHLHETSLSTRNSNTLPDLRATSVDMRKKTGTADKTSVLQTSNHLRSRHTEGTLTTETVLMKALDVMSSTNLSAVFEESGLSYISNLLTAFEAIPRFTRTSKSPQVNSVMDTFLRKGARFKTRQESDIYGSVSKDLASSFRSLGSMLSAQTDIPAEFAGNSPTRENLVIMLKSLYSTCSEAKNRLTHQQLDLLIEIADSFQSLTSECIGLPFDECIGLPFNEWLSVLTARVVTLYNSILPIINDTTFQVTLINLAQELVLPKLCVILSLFADLLENFDETSVDTSISNFLKHHLCLLLSLCGQSVDLKHEYSVKVIWAVNWAYEFFGSVFPALWLVFSIILESIDRNHLDPRCIQITDGFQAVLSSFHALHSTMTTLPSSTDNLGFERLKLLLNPVNFPSSLIQQCPISLTCDEYGSLPISQSDFDSLIDNAAKSTHLCSFSITNYAVFPITVCVDLIFKNGEKSWKELKANGNIKLHFSSTYKTYQVDFLDIRIGKDVPCQENLLTSFCPEAFQCNQQLLTISADETYSVTNSIRMLNVFLTSSALNIGPMINNMRHIHTLALTLSDFCVESKSFPVRELLPMSAVGFKLKRLEIWNANSNLKLASSIVQEIAEVLSKFQLEKCTTKFTNTTGKESTAHLGANTHQLECLMIHLNIDMSKFQAVKRDPIIKESDMDPTDLNDVMDCIEEPIHNLSNLLSLMKQPLKDNLISNVELACKVKPIVWEDVFPRNEGFMTRHTFLDLQTHTDFVARKSDELPYTTHKFSVTHSQRNVQP